MNLSTLCAFHASVVTMPSICKPMSAAPLPTISLKPIIPPIRHWTSVDGIGSTGTPRRPCRRHSRLGALLVQSVHCPCPFHCQSHCASAECAPCPVLGGLWHHCWLAEHWEHALSSDDVVLVFLPRRQLMRRAGPPRRTKPHCSCSRRTSSPTRRQCAAPASRWHW